MSTRSKKKRSKDVDAAVGSNSQYSANSLMREGCEIASKARWARLQEQQRSNDVLHMLLLKKMENGEMVTLDDLKQYKPLSPEDVGRNEDWLKAPYLVSTNRERHNIVHLQSRRFARNQKCHVFRWIVDYQEWQQKPLDSKHIKKVLRDPCFYEYCVPGSYGFFTEALNKKRSIVNGTRFKYHEHALIPCSEEQKKEIERETRERPFGSMVTLKKPPLGLVVELIDEVDVSVWKDVTLVEGKIVIPVIAGKTNSKKSKWEVAVLPGGDGFLPSKLKIRNLFPVETAFAITVHKAQGRTLGKVVLVLSCRESQKCNFTYAHFYVALSRVKKGSDIRLLLDIDAEKNYVWENLSYITALKPNKAIKAYFDGYDGSDGCYWNKNAAVDVYVGK